MRDNVSTDDNANANIHIGTEIQFGHMMKKERSHDDLTPIAMTRPIPTPAIPAKER